MIYQLLVIIGLAGIFVVLVRRFPATGGSGESFSLPRFNFKLPQLKVFKLPNLFNMLKVFKLPKLAIRTLKMPLFQIPKAQPTLKPVLDDDDILSRADQAYASKDIAKAETLYIQSATKHPREPRIYGRLGVIYLQQKNYKDARDALITSIKFDETIASRHYNLALAYQGLGNLKKALEVVKEAIELDPANDKYELLRKKLGG